MMSTRVVVSAGTVGAVALAAHTAFNLRALRTPAPPTEVITESVCVLIPARDEAAHVVTTVRSVLAQSGLMDLRVIVLDDGSKDDTADLVRAVAVEDDRVRLVSGDDTPPPAGWLGKPWACQRLAADAGEATVLCFVDADVVLETGAIASAVALLREGSFALVAPYPRQQADAWLERLVQPLVTWSWAATLPLRWAETSTRPSLSAANGQFLVFDAAAYNEIGGHEAVRGNVLEDIGLMRAVKVAGWRTVTVDGSTLAHCRMYEGSAAVVDGYAKSLWSGFNGPMGTIATCATLTLVYVLPAVAAVAARDRRTRVIGAIGYAAGVASRAMVARRTGEPVLPDTLAQPASIAAFTALNAVSWWRHLRGANAWKGRPVTVGSNT